MVIMKSFSKGVDEFDERGPIDVEVVPILLEEEDVVGVLDSAEVIEAQLADDGIVEVDAFDGSEDGVHGLDDVHWTHAALVAEQDGIPHGLGVHGPVGDTLEGPADAGVVDDDVVVEGGDGPRPEGVEELVEAHVQGAASRVDVEGLDHGVHGVRSWSLGG